MKRLKSALVLSTAIALSTAAASAASLLDTFDGDVADLRETTFDGDSFTQRLADNYRTYALYEADVMYDWIDAAHFAEKAKMAGSGEVVGPERPGDWSIGNETRLKELQDARAVLVSVLDDGAREYSPDAAALAQAKYDCWVEQQEEGWQYNHIAACRNEFLAAVRALRATLEPDYPDLAGRLYFEFDETDLTPAAKLALDRLAEEIKAEGASEVIVVGHADRAGNADYNVELSRLRAKTVANALRDRGVTGITVDYQLIAMGERAPILETGDGVAAQANRRVAVFVDEPEVVVNLR